MADDPAFVMRSEFSSNTEGRGRTLRIPRWSPCPVGSESRRRYKDVVKICSVGILIIPDLFAFRILGKNWQRGIDAAIEVLTM